MDIQTIVSNREKFSEGVFRVKRYRNGWVMSDITGTLPFLPRHVDTVDSLAYYPVDGQVVKAGVAIDYDKRGKVQALAARVAPVSEADSFLLILPRDGVPTPGDVVILDRLIQSLSSHSLRNFCNRLFSDPSLALKYVTSPASDRHHHATPGGLLRHSLEMAMQVLAGNLPITLSDNEREIVVISCLVHDLGKVVTHGDSGRYLTSRHHEMITMNLIGTALKKLEEEWADGANAIVAVLSDCALTKHRHSSRMSMTLSTLDRLSAFIDAERQAFDDKPDSWWFSYLGNERYWRLSELQ